MDHFKSQIIHVVNTVDKLNIQERLEALNYLQKITDAYKNKSLSSDFSLETSSNVEPPKNLNKNFKHRCKNHLCLTNNIKHLKKIACFKCEKRLESEFQLFDHSQTHLDYPISCLFCRCVFRNAEDYNSHKSADCGHDNELPQCVQKYVCKVCKSSFSTKKTFQSHSLNNHGMKLYDNWYGCKLCHEMFEQKKSLYHHYKEMHSELKNHLENAGQSGISSNTATQEEQNTSNKVNDNEMSNEEESEEAEKFQCVHCGKSFRKKFMLSVHIKRHLRENEFICKLCKKTFNVYRYYKRHLQSASHQNKDGQDNHPIFKCDICEKIFANRDSLSRHQLRVHFTAEKRLKCPLCDFKTSLAASLSRHINLHTDNRKFICDQCGSCFHTLSALKDHTVYVHSNERNYSCEVCGQRFKLKSGLNRHFKTHSSEKEFKCFCGQVYKFRTNLRRHLMTAHKISGKKNSVTRVTTEEKGYAINAPKVVKQKNKLNKEPIDTNKIDEFDISSLGALSDVDLSCADEVLRETYNFSKYSTENPEALNSILAPDQLIDHVLQEANNAGLSLPKPSIMDGKQFSMVVEPFVENNLSSMNYRAGTCRQYLNSNFSDALSNEYTPQVVNKVDNQYLNASYDGASSMIENAYGRQYQSQYLPEVPVEDESTFSYSKWCGEFV